jgi:Na+/proline symporter
MLAGLLAALMSSLTSNFNSSSSVFTIDIWKQFRPKVNEFEEVLVGRIFSLFMIGASIAWLPILQALQGGNLWDYIQSISSYITPPWVVVFLLGMFWKRCTERVSIRDRYLTVRSNGVLRRVLGGV